MPLTLIDRVPLGSPLLSEEIFGPLLPIVSYSSLEDATRTIRSVDPTPLSLYVFTRVDEVAETLMASIQVGAVVGVMARICHCRPRVLPSRPKLPRLVPLLLRAAPSSSTTASCST